MHIIMSKFKHTTTMKKILYIAIAAALTLSSCSDDFLDQSPSITIPTENAFNDVKDVATATNGLYALMASTNYYNASMFLYGDLKGDGLVPTYWSSGRISYRYYYFEHSAVAPNSGGLWGRPYYIIRNAYNIIDAIESGKVSGNKAQLDTYKGEALAAIALCYFDLTRVYGYPYAKDNGKSAGVPILKHAIQNGDEADRNTVAECYNFVIETLKKAIPLLPTTKTNGRINSFAARALLARTYLYCEKNAEAFETADKLIQDLKNNAMYYLTSNANYVAMFDHNNKFNNEALFQIANTDSSNPGRDGLSFYLHWWGYAAVGVADDFYHNVFNDDDDVRKQFIVDRGEYYILEKYPGPDNYWTPAFTNNYTVLRLSEVYLIAAEAGVKVGGEKRPTALAYLNNIVERANPDASVSDDEFDLDRVLLERARELIGEGHRYFDQLRNGKKIVRTGANHLDGAPKEIDWNYYKCVLPIERDEFTFHPDMEQNEGYSKE